MSAEYHRIVIKLGTSVLTGGTPQLNRPQIVELVRQCALLHSQGRQPIIVTSGAIAAGRERLGFPDLESTVTVKQLYAAVGQSRLMAVWEQLFDLYGINVGQILLTRSDVEDRRRYLNARDTLLTLLKHGIVPIVNENDAVATEEIKVGDNDNLSALVTLLADADLLVLLTDQRGLYTADPRVNPNAELIAEVRNIDQGLRSLAGKGGSGLGVGGMATKLQAADVARRSGADVIIAAGSIPDVISRLVAGESLGTRFPALETPLESRKRWILAGPSPSGFLRVDQGAMQALRVRGKSLLPAGIVEVEGQFERGDTIRILGPNQEPVARGIVRYPSADLARIAGLRSDEIAGRLGYDYGAVAVHRNDLILI
jgi:glutamate 5-kinase